MEEGGGGGGRSDNGWGFDQEVKIFANFRGWGRIRSSNVVKNPHPGAYFTNLIKAGVNMNLNEI